MKLLVRCCVALLCIAALARTAARADAEAPQAYATWTQGATPQRGLFTIWHKGGHAYMELSAAQLDHDFVQTIVPGSGLGGWFVVWGNTDHLPAELVRFTRAGNQIAILWPNPNFIAPGSAVANALGRAFPQSIVGMAPIVAEDAQSGAVVMDLAPFTGDMLDMRDIFKQYVPVPDPSAEYQLNGDRSYVSVTKAFPRNVVIEAQQDWTTEKPTVLDTAPDPRNVQMRVVYNIAEPPGDSDYMPRLADDRVGIYDDIYLDFSNDKVDERQLRYIVRWNIQPSDPARAMSPSKHPLVFTLSNTIPPQYRPAVRRGVLEWNKAFEKLGISNAIQVIDQPGDPTWDADDIRYNVIRWVPEARTSFGADSQTLYDPRTGQEFRTGILVSADVGFFPRLEWKWAVDPIRYGRATDPVPQSFIDQSIFAVVLHETGHNMGMQHNFIASEAYTARELQDPSFTARYGTTASAMEYAPINLWPRQYRQGDYFQRTIGPYDYYAMRYAYGPIRGARTPEDELPTLRRWASGWSDPRYRYASDEDVAWGTGHAADPRVMQGDLTNDPLSWCNTQVSMYRGLMQKLNQFFPSPQRAYEEETNAYFLVVGRQLNCARLPAFYIGGQYLSRAHRGDPGAASPITPVPRDVERRAFAMLDSTLFSDRAWMLPASVLDKLGYSEWAGYGYGIWMGNYGGEPPWAYAPPARHYTSLPTEIGRVQDDAIAQMFNPLVLQRIDENPMLAAPAGTMSIADLFDWMQSSVYRELGNRDLHGISLLRRNLQQSYERTLIGLVKSPRDGTPDDAQSLAREELSAIANDAGNALRSRALDSVTRAHLDSLRARAETALSVR